MQGWSLRLGKWRESSPLFNTKLVMEQAGLVPGASPFAIRLQGAGALSCLALCCHKLYQEQMPIV